MQLLPAILSLTILSCSTASAQTSAHDTIDVAILGDSNTWLGGDHCDKPKGWNTYFKAAYNPKSCVSFARSGATWTNTTNTVLDREENVGIITDNNVIYNQVCRLIEATEDHKTPRPHLIIIACGTNDAWFEKKRPLIWSASVDDAIADETIVAKDPSENPSLAQSVVQDCLLIRQFFPSTQIVLLTPLQTTAVSIDKIGRIADTIQKCGDLLGIPVIRQDKVCVVKASNEKQHRTNTYDGTHTNATGAKANGEIIAAEISKLTDNPN
jgi:lysophospholipase L1-like esterase